MSLRRALRSAVRAAAFVGSLLALLALPARARAGGLTRDEQAALGRGEVVKRKLVFELDDERYTGGIAYVIVRAPLRDVMTALVDVGAYKSILPLVAEARAVGERGGDPLITVKHWARVATAAYTVRLRREGPGLVRFWLDKAYPADVDDCWGYFRVTRIDKDTSLLTYGAVMNLGFGFARIFLESKVQDYALTTPDLVRRYVEDRRARPALLGR